jgi:predicted GIY-YIG superfamily endonuclease
MEKSRFVKIYALYYKEKPIYIGKTIRDLDKRYKDHKNDCFRSKVSNKLYEFIRSEMTEEQFKSLVVIKLVKEVENKYVNYWEMKTIRFCLSKGVYLYNTIGVDYGRNYDNILKYELLKNKN